MPRTRPSSIQELANEAVQNNWDPSKDLKFYLKQAEKFRKVGKEYADSGDIESAFIEYARAATLVLEKLPQHKDYHTMLSKQQRQNLSLNGQDILDSLGELKPVLVQRHEQWTTRHPNDTTTPTARSVKAQQPSPEDDDRRRKMAEEVYRMKQQREGGYNMPYPPPSHAPSHPPSGMPAPSAPPDPRANAALAAARQAAGSSSSASQAARHRQQPPSSHPALDPRQAEAARAVQQRLAGGNGIVTSTSSTPIYQMPTASPAPAMYPSRHPSTRTAPYQTFQQPDVTSLQMPLERPGYDDYGDSTDSESVSGSNNYTSRPHTGPSYPISDLVARMDDLRTTTSPGPDHGSIAYPKLMSQHQKSQGYVPSTIYTPANGHTGNTSAMFFQDSRPSKGLYSNDLLPSRSHSGMPPTTSRLPSAYPTPTHPPSAPAPTHSHQPTPAPDSPPNPGQLKTVHIPRDCFSRFLDIASLNTSRNKETCGLLLGKAKGHKYIVSTLLIPKQHSTSDTCAMDEEELVLQFTEERSLITLGWIHTHPSQSCFMSSVDLHTHSGFQRMLPESFAVVCAPKSTPSVGIFRLTDPPGLKTILDCNAKESFHPHPDLPIYTDADKGHVKVKDIPLEIVDIRN